MFVVTFYTWFGDRHVREHVGIQCNIINKEELRCSCFLKLYKPLCLASYEFV